MSLYIDHSDHVVMFMASIAASTATIESPYRKSWRARLERRGRGDVRAEFMIAALPFIRHSLAGFIGLCILLNTALASAAPGWSAAASLQTARYGHTATLLPNGKVLVAGGIANAELYDPATNTWTAAGALAMARINPTSTLLPNGKVLVAGGYNGDYLASAELYDLATNIWTDAGALATGRTVHTATLLPNGKVLVAGGEGLNRQALASAELYDPATNTWTAAGALATAHTLHTATQLPNGKVLIVGGAGDTDILASSELYDPATNAWTAVGALPTLRAMHTATLLPNGMVLVAGGSSSGIGGAYLAGAVLYDPATNAWILAGALATGRDSHTATLLPNGKVLIAGGSGIANSRYGTLASAELYDPATNIWMTAGALATARFGHTATLLSNGEVLLAGGAQNTMTWEPPLYNVFASAELFFDLPPVVEFYNTNLDHYFITADASEAASIDKGSAGAGWIRTGNSFNSGGNIPVCRFYGSVSPGPNSHFYTADVGECNFLKGLQASTPDTEKRWNFEGLAFVSTPPTNGVCPTGTTPVYRAYNNGFSRGIDSNHRITSSLAAIQEVVNRGWNNEGVVMCAPNL